MTPLEVVDGVKKSGLRGRGGAEFSTGMKWSFLDRKSEKPRYLVCNADESEPGTFKDRYFLEKIPHRLIEGMIVSSYALGASRAYIYIRGELMWLAKRLEHAIAKQNLTDFWETIYWGQIIVSTWLFIPVQGRTSVGKKVLYWSPWRENGGIPD